MAELVFEIWENPDDCSFEMSRVSSRLDELRRQIAPNSLKRHTFTAGSDFEAAQTNYDWHGWGLWKAPGNMTEQFFSEAENDEQRRYLAIRNDRFPPLADARRNPIGW